MATAAITAAVAARPNRADRNAAIAAAAAAQVAATCPWNSCDTSETGSTASSRQPSSRNTCPWGNEVEAQQKPSRSLRAAAPRDTCPWGTGANDMDSARLADADRRRKRPSPTNYGAAGSGAPKLFSSMAEAGVVAQNIPPVREEGPEVTQRADAAMPCMQLAPTSDAHGAQFMPPSKDDEDEEQREQREIIQQCLAEGLSEDEIMEMLEEWENAKLIQHTREKMKSDQPTIAATRGPTQSQAATASSLAATGTSLGATGASLVASRQAKAKKSLSFGPTDEEIVDVLKDYAKENLTPPESPPNVVTLAAMRKKVKEPSEASVGSFDSEKSRAAYLQSKSQMDAVKSKNRMSSGIF